MWKMLKNDGRICLLSFFYYSKLMPLFGLSPKFRLFTSEREFFGLFSPLKYLLSVHSSNLAFIKTVHIVQP